MIITRNKNKNKKNNRSKIILKLTAKNKINKNFKSGNNPKISKLKSLKSKNNLSGGMFGSFGKVTPLPFNKRQVVKEGGVY